MKFKLITIFISVFVIFISCDKLLPPAPEESEILDGPMENLSYEQRLQFLRGDDAFNEVFTKESGLGPIFVANSCASCHSGDGKGHPFTTLTRFGQDDTTGNKYLNQGGNQLQHRALPGYKPETLPEGASHSDFIAPAVTGLGFLAYLTDESIIEMSDPNDANGDGISGVVNWIEIPDYINPSTSAISQNGKYIGRFGKKASAYNLLHQTVGAYNQDMGIASFFNPIDVYSNLEIEPEVSNQTIYDLDFYLHTLKAPIQRNQNNPEVIKGKVIFGQINCGSCHKETLRTGYSPIEALSNKEFHPYTDLLLHDMGSELDDNYTEGSALTSEWRTPALWGLGLSADSQGGQYYLMHDGRARSIEEAILFHGGEAERSKNLYLELNKEDKNSLIKFLKSL